jgi:hypothetical protein
MNTPTIFLLQDQYISYSVHTSTDHQHARYHSLIHSRYHISGSFSTIVKNGNVIEKKLKYEGIVDTGNRIPCLDVLDGDILRL